MNGVGRIKSNVSTSLFDMVLIMWQRHRGGTGIYVYCYVASVIKVLSYSLLKENWLI